jgi:hypothetical protein
MRLAALDVAKGLGVSASGEVIVRSLGLRWPDLAEFDLDLPSPASIPGVAVSFACSEARAGDLGILGTGSAVKNEEGRSADSEAAKEVCEPDRFGLDDFESRRVERSSLEADSLVLLVTGAGPGPFFMKSSKPSVVSRSSIADGRTGERGSILALFAVSRFVASGALSLLLARESVVLERTRLLLCSGAGGPALKKSANEFISSWDEVAVADLAMGVPVGLLVPLLPL